jgi:DNA-binding IclR family transcriptional regulator
MEKVQARVRQHTQLSVLSNTEVLCIDRMSTRDAVVNATVIGGRIPLHASSSGLVLLAHSDESHLEQVIKAGLQQFTPDTIHTPEDLIKALRKVHADGAAICSGHIYPESRGIAVPVYDGHHHVIAALGVVVPNDDAPSQPYIELLTLAAREISKSLLSAYTPSRGENAQPGGSLRPLVHSSIQSMTFLESLHKGQR